MQRAVHVGSMAIANDLPFTLIAGPCEIESRAHALEVASALREMSMAADVPLIYKSRISTRPTARLSPPHAARASTMAWRFWPRCAKPPACPR